MIPKPNKGEIRKDYVCRVMCDEEMKKEYPDAARRAGICHVAYDEAKLKAGENLPDHIDGILPEDKTEMKLETKRLENVEIIRTGTFNGRKFTEKELDEAVVNFKAGIIDPYINIAHDDKLTKDMKKILGVFSFGWVDSLWRDGKKLLANFKQVPKMVAEWIESGALKQRSVEWWHVFRQGDGKKITNVLEAVTFFGANGIPAVNSLSDIMDLYKSVLTRNSGNRDGDKGVILFEKRKENHMAEITDAELEIFKQLKADREKAKAVESEELTTLKAKQAADEKAAKEKDAEIAKLKKEGEERDKKEVEAKKTALQAEGKKFIDKIVLAKKLAPAYQADEIARYVELKGAIDSADDAGKKAATERFDRFTKRHEEAGEVVNFEALPDVGTDNGEPDRSVLQDSDKLEKAIAVRMKAKNEKWEDARKGIYSDLGVEV